MTARNSGIGNGEEFLRPEVGQRPPKRESTFGQRKPLERKTPLKSKWKPRTRMSADAQVQEAMLGKGRCWFTDHEPHRCTDGDSQRAHIVPQALIRNTFPLGAYRSNGFARDWRPIEEWMDERTTHGEIRSLQEILDDNRNFAPACPNGNIDGPDMVAALEDVGYPPGFDDYKCEYGWEFNGSYWYREVKPVVLDPRLDSGDAA